MKTIFITAYHGFISRNLFNTDVLKILKRQNDLRIVIFTPPLKRDFIEKYYGGGNVIVEGFDLDEVIRIPFNKFWYRLAFLLENTRYVKDKRLENLYHNKNILGYMRYGCVNMWALILSRLQPTRAIYRFLDFYFSPKNLVTPYIEKYQPTLLFATDIFGEHDVLFLRQVKLERIPIVGMVRSWDNTTTKGVIRVMPNKIVVNSQVVKEELVRFHDYSEKNIFVVGLPQFDYWLQGPTLTREEFFKRIGADPAKRLILFAPAGEVLSDTDWQLCQILKDAIVNGQLPSNIQFLVRNHPHHPADLSRFKPDKHFIIEIPGQQIRANDYKQVELNPDDSSHLLNSVYYSDFVMYIATTLGLDATVFDKPQIMVSFDGWETKPYIQSVQRYNLEDCLANLTKLGGTKVVTNKEDWIEAINTYLDNPKLDEEGRKKTVNQHMYKIDGKAGERIAHIILSQLYGT